MDENTCWFCWEQIHEDELVCGWCKLQGYTVTPSPDPEKPHLGAQEIPVDLEDLR